ncbi:MAG: hypothetical protein IPN33_12555 [Saprospiraceae bacterium]|nr:hypothetical protein [Saprospiraceae bacterium]
MWPFLPPTTKGTGWVMYFDCERFGNYSGARFMILDKSVTDLEAAKRRITALRKAGVPASAMSTTCVPFDAGEGFLVYLDLLQSDSLYAAGRLKIYQQRLRKADLPASLRIVQFSTGFSD